MFYVYVYVCFYFLVCLLFSAYFAMVIHGFNDDRLTCTVKLYTPAVEDNDIVLNLTATEGLRFTSVSKANRYYTSEVSQVC